MPVELRKRKAPEPAPAPAPKKASAKVTKAAAKVKEAVKAKPAKAAAKPAAEEPAVEEHVEEKPAEKPAANGSGKATKGETIDLDGFGGEIETNDGEKTTLKELVAKSKAGVVLFTYPKASTPGCTKQACLFRDEYEPLTKTGLDIYGLSMDSPKANTTFKTKQKLPYPLLCDPKATLISAIGLKKAPKSTQRGVFVVDKAGKVLLAEPGSPAGTVEAVQALVEDGSADAEPAAADAKEEKEPANGEAKADEKEDAAEKADEKEEKKDE